MGVEGTYQRQGWGRLLIERAIEWASLSRKVDWIDLRVFGTNVGAQQLYAKMGFVEVGRMKDQIRIDGESIEDVRMTRRI
jgi:ribosomal protein S18 acetylase RimI-like enzyme